MPEAHPGELRSAHIVEQMQGDIRGRVDAYREETNFSPHLQILTDNTSHKPSQKYIEMKDQAGYALGIGVGRIDLPQDFDVDRHVKHCQSILDRASEGDFANGIIVQLPMVYPEMTDDILAHIKPEKDVDGLVTHDFFKPATPNAIVKLLEGHDIDYRDDLVVVLGLGRLVGAPVKELLEEQGAKYVEGFDIDSDETTKLQAISEAKIIISAMGQPGMLTTDLFDTMEHPRVLVDAGTAEQGGVVKGDVDPELRQAALDHGWRITPRGGGVGPLTVHMLLSNVVGAAEQQAARIAA